MDLHKFNKIVDEFKSAKDVENKSLGMHYLLVKNSDAVHVHAFNDRTVKSDIRSISKTVMTLVAGIVHKRHLEGKYPAFTEDTFIYPIIKDSLTLTNTDNLHFLEEVRVKHLLTHSVGFDEILLMRDDIKDMDPNEYLNHIVNHPIVHEPGTHYLYSNAGFYLLSVVLQEFLKEDLLNFIDRELFKPLGITDYSWERYGDYLAGATRLWMFPTDLVKIGELMLHRGIYAGQVIVPAEWIAKMLIIRFRTELEDTPGATFRRYGYGWGTWLAEKDFYFGHGTDGQILAVLPDHDCIVVVQAYQHDMAAIEQIIDKVVSDTLSPPA